MPCSAKLNKFVTRSVIGQKYLQPFASYGEWTCFQLCLIRLNWTRNTFLFSTWHYSIQLFALNLEFIFLCTSLVVRLLHLAYCLWTLFIVSPYPSVTVLCSCQSDIQSDRSWQLKWHWMAMTIAGQILARDRVIRGTSLDFLHVP